MFRMGKNHRGGGLFMLPGLLFGGLFGIYAMFAVLNVAGVIIGAVFSGMAAAFSRVMSGIVPIVSDIRSMGGLMIGIVLGIALHCVIRNHRKYS